MILSFLWLFQIIFLDIFYEKSKVSDIKASSYLIKKNYSQVNDDLVKVCVIWGTWSILREAFEFAENSESLMHKGPGLCSMIESIVVIVLSITMIAHPSEHHAHVHIFLLGIELILEVVFPLLYLLWYRKHPKHSEE